MCAHCAVTGGNLASRDTVQYQAVLAFPVLDGVLYRTVPDCTVPSCDSRASVQDGDGPGLDRLIITAIHDPIPHPPSPIRSAELGGGSSDGDSNHSNHSNHSAFPRPTRWWSGRRKQGFKDSKTNANALPCLLPPLPGPPWPSLPLVVF
jgi:hypothetical protein